MNKRSMKIVEEYLEDGCVFAEGDYCTDNLYGHIYGELHGAHSWIHHIEAFSEDEVTKFTWRNSIGTPPTYTNLVEVKQRNGAIYVDYVKNIDFTLELSDDDVVQWKPYIECDLDWHLKYRNVSLYLDVNVSPRDWITTDGYEFNHTLSIDDLPKHTNQSMTTLWKNPKFYKYNRGE